MSALSIQPPFPIFTETDGQPLENGYIWLGTINLNPIVNPISAYWDAALTIAAVQPIRTLNGYPVYLGTPARIYVNSDYSIQVQNRNGSVVYSAPAATERYGGIINASDVVYDPAGTGAVATTVQTKLRESVSVKDFGAVGDGTTNDTAAIQLAINAAPMFLDLVGKTYRVTVKLIFSVAGMTIKNGTLKFDGPITDRLANVTAANVAFENVIFDGNSKQPRSALVYVDASVDRPKFLNCTFKNLTCVNNGTSVLNQTYGLLINPYAVTNFLVSNCLFKDLVKYNDGINGTPTATATVGLGFIGGICFLPEDMSEPTAAQPTPTSGIVEGCTFDNIQTILAAALSIGNQADFNDADAIRTYGYTGGAERLDVHVADCIFRNVSKRAFKFRAAGSVAHDCEVYADGMQYGMIVPIDVTSNAKVYNIKVYASVSKPVQSGVQWSIGPDYNQETLVQGIFISHCIVGVGFFSDPTNQPLRNLVLRDIFINQASAGGIRQGTPLPSTQENIVIENVQIFGSGNNCTGITITGANDVTGGIQMNNVLVVNGSIDIGGVNNSISNLEVEITSSAYAGETTSQSLFRVGQNGYGGYQHVENFFVNAWNLNTSFLNGSRLNLGNFIGDNATWENIRIKVPDALTTSYSHGEFYGNDWCVDGFTYDGPGYIFVGTSLASVRWAMKNCVRLGNGASIREFLYTSNAGTGNGLFENVTDFRPTTNFTININNGLGVGNRFIATNVASKTSNATIVQNGGLATVVNAINFP
jgi:hypothetical protein